MFDFKWVYNLLEKCTNHAETNNPRRKKENALILGKTSDF